MNFRLTQVERRVISCAHCPGKIENAGLCFQRQAKARAEISVAVF